MISDLLTEAKQKMEMAADHVGNEFATIRTGRANPQLLHRITVDYYDTPTPLHQLASIGRLAGAEVVKGQHEVQVAELRVEPVRESRPKNLNLEHVMLATKPTNIVASFLNQWIQFASYAIAFESPGCSKYITTTTPRPIRQYLS